MINGSRLHKETFPAANLYFERLLLGKEIRDSTFVGQIFDFSIVWAQIQSWIEFS